MNHSTEQFVTLAVILGIITIAMMPGRWRGSGTSGGTARQANENDLKRAGMLGKTGLILGQMSDGRLIRMPRYQMLSCFAPTGAGKGVSLIVPWLQTINWSSVVVLDPKGENAQLTIARRRAMGQKVVVLDPFRVTTETPDTFNPLDLIGDGPDCVDDARAMTEAMVHRTGEEKDPHWNDQAANICAALLAFILADFKNTDRNLSTLREMVSQVDLSEIAVAAMRKKGGVFARMVGVISQLEDKEKAGVFSTVHRHTTFLDSNAIMASVSPPSSFDARELLNGNMTIYVIFPPHQLEAQARWLRLIISSLLRLIGREGMRDGKECLFILDEAGQLGHMPAIDQGLTLLRGYGLKMAFFFQSLGQLKETFRNKESVLLDNTEQIYFGVNSYDTASLASKMLGNRTITVEGAGESNSWSQAHGQQQSKNSSSSMSRDWKEQSREIMKPEEVLQMSGEYLLAFLRNVRPIICRRVKWYQDSRLGGRRAPRGLELVWWLLLIASVGLIVWGLWK